MDLTRGRYEYPRLRAIAIALAERFKPDRILIEDASTGTALAPDLRTVIRRAVTLVRVDRDKVGRLYVEQGKFSAGLVLFRENAPYLPELEAELLAFPHGKTNDQVDSISQALNHKLTGYTLENLT